MSFSPFFYVEIEKIAQKICLIPKNVLLKRFSMKELYT